MAIAKVLAKGQVVIPKDIRDKIHISPGDKVEVEIVKNSVVIMPIKKTNTDKFIGVAKGKLSFEQLENLYAEKS